MIEKNIIEIKNKRAAFEYFLMDEYTAGIVLMGSEIKSIREGKANLGDAWCTFIGNELFVRDLSKREKYIDIIVKRIGDRPFLWIGPPNWKKDTGINDLIRQRVGEGRFFDSRELELDRAEDNMHPTRSAAALWMDTIAVWLSSSKARHPLKMDRPTQSRRRVYHQYMLRPPQ